MDATDGLPDVVQRLLSSGVVIDAPHTVAIGAEVDPDRISPGVVIHAGCRLRGSSTAIGPGCVIGDEQPATVDSCQLGAGVRLGGGYFAGSVFLDSSSVSSGAHVRPVCLLEEGARAAHSVGLKHTILMPWVTLGSLINFCDVLACGGTSMSRYTEVGSSYVHFNLSPHGDKATPSMLGDVPRGVMLDQPPVFLGGQGGMVGPLTVAFGCVAAAGSVLRTECVEQGRLIAPAPLAAPQALPYDATGYRAPARIVRRNLVYIGNLRALSAWYATARERRLSGDAWRRLCHQGARRVLRAAIEERIGRLMELLGNLGVSMAYWQRQERGNDADGIVAQHRALLAASSRLVGQLADDPDRLAGARERDRFLAALDRAPASLHWPETVQGLDAAARAAGSRWLDAIVATSTDLMPALPSEGGAGGERMTHG